MHTIIISWIRRNQSFLQSKVFTANLMKAGKMSTGIIQLLVSITLRSIATREKKHL